MAHAVDQLFAQWAGPDSPGASIAIIQNGKIVYSQGYGAANLEYGVPNSPATVFHLASVSKQFTAFAIYLLVQDGRLSLDDDVRKYLPKLHDFGKVITIRQLLHHTSGVREQWNLLCLAGWRPEDVITDDDVARLLFQQTELNFAPGDQFLYSNSGYTLLAMVVKQVSGKTLPAFAKERIFDPLGMAHTHFQDDYGIVVKDRAYSYARQPDGKYQYVALSDSTVGPSSLFSTVADLARWDENFYTGEVGGPALLAQMQEKGKLNNGEEIEYASGLEIGKYRGLRTVEHGGGAAAYRTRVRNSLNPPYKAGNQADGRQVVSAQPVVSSCDAPKILQPVERALDAPSKFVEALAEAERLLSIASVGNDRLGSTLVQFLMQLGAVVSLVAEHAFRRLHSADEALRDWAIVRFTSGQQDGDEASFSICECMNLRVAPST